MTESAPLPLPDSAVAVSPATRRARWPDAILVVLVLAFAFLAASFAARNSDFWLHLAAGRLLAHGEYTFGTDPFAYTTHGVYWANHAWLFDLALHAGYQALGGPGLVALKAVAVTVLAGLLLLLSRPRSDPRGPFWVSGGCVLLAVLAMSPRLLMQPMCLSYLLLAVCLWLLRTGGRALYALPVVVALWVNLDSWFLLGPLLVVLYGLGQLLASPGNRRRLPLWLLPASLAACLLSPHHIHALTLPAELSPDVWFSDFRHDVHFAPLFASPWRWAPLGSAGGYSLAAWAYVVLLGLSLVSFAVNRPALHGWRGPVWLVFALLGAWQVRLVPFFAVVAGPITALNFRGRLSRDALAGLGRTGLLLAGLALVALTWPGWLQGFQRHERGLAWAVHVDPSLRRLADTLTSWRRQDILPGPAHLFAAHPDVGHYCAWFCPGEKGFLDSRLQLFLPVAGDYRHLCQALDPAGSSDVAWQTLLRNYHIAGLVLYDPNLSRLVPGLRQATLAPEIWELLRVDGLAVIVGCKETETARLAGLRLDAGRLAFGPGHDEALPPALAEGPAELVRPFPWWHSYIDRPDGSTWEADAAAVYLLLFEADLARRAPPDVEELSPALHLLGVRAARRAVAAQPEDAGGWLVLGQASMYLGQWGGAARDHALPPLTQIRYIQAVTAFEQVVTLRPDLAPAHAALAALYEQRRYLDLALRHSSAHLHLAREAGRLPGEDQATFTGRLDRLAKAAGQLQAQVQDSENRFIVHSQPLAADPLARTRLALQLGLAGKALDEVLLRSHPDLYGVEGLRLLLELLLFTGRAQDARDLLDREELRRLPEALGYFDLSRGLSNGRRWGYRFLAFDWFDCCQAAAAGNYERAGRALDRLRARMERQGNHNSALLGPAIARRLTSEVGLGAVSGALPLRIFGRLEREQLAGLVVQNLFQLVERADLHAVEGMLLLERGLPEQAGEQFRHALALYPLAADTAPALPGQSLAHWYWERIRAFTRRKSGRGD